MSNDTLKECPFCGASNAKMVVVMGSHGVFCRECDALGPAKDSEDEAAALWNRRAAQVEQPTLPDFANAQRFIWLCEDRDDAHTRAVRDDILSRMSGMGIGAITQAIDYAMMGEYHLPDAVGEQAAPAPEPGELDVAELAFMQTHLRNIAEAVPPTKVTSANPHAKRQYTLADAKSDARMCLLAIQRLIGANRVTAVNAVGEQAAQQPSQSSYSNISNNSIDVGVSQPVAPQQRNGWKITAPDGRTWSGETILRAASAAQRDTIDPVLAMERINFQVAEGAAEDLAELRKVAEAVREAAANEMCPAIRSMISRGEAYNLIRAIDIDAIIESVRGK